MACKHNREYCVVPGDSEVEAWAIDRVQFEPKTEWQKCFKKELYRAVDKLRDGCPQKGLVHATYRTKVQGGQPYDLENVLFYDFGIKCWKTNMRFEKGTGTFPEAKCETLPDGRTASQYAHHYHYMRRDAAEANPFTCWSLEEPLVRIEEVRFVENAGPCMQDCASVWYECKMALAQRGPESPASKPKRFAVLLKVTRPSGSRLRCVCPKGLFDGVISCLHKCRPQDEERILAGLVVRLEGLGIHVSENDVRRLLRSGAGAVLGEGQFADRAMRLTPQDDLCLAGEMKLLEDKDEAAVWKLSATVYDV